MADTLTDPTPTVAPSACSSELPAAPPAPPQPPSNLAAPESPISDAPQSGSPDRGSPNPERRRRWRFAGGLATGVALSAVAVGAVALVRDDGTTGTSVAEQNAPTAGGPTSTGTESDANTPSVGAGAPGSVHDLVTAVRPSIVAIHTTLTQTDVFGQQVEGEAAGSGFVLSADGYVVTNNHVIEGADEISVTLDDGSSEPAELIAADPRSDLAVLHVDRVDLTPLELGDSDAIRVGDPVVAIGNALDLGAEPTVTGGMVSAKDRTITEPNGQVLVNLIQTDAAISPGNSGGPLLDLDGRVVGINTAVAGQGQNIGFAIAIQPAKVLIDQLRDGAVPRHALLGVSTRTLADSNQANGVEITAIEPGSGADTGGLKVGDVITQLDDDTITTPEDLVASIARHQPGDSVTVTADRNGTSRTFDVTLGARDETNS